MISNRRIVIALVAVCVVVTHAAAQEVKLGGQLRPRFETRDPYSVTATGGDWFVSMRARANVAADLEENVKVFVQIQDVRVWGEEGNTLSDFSAYYFLNIPDAFLDGCELLSGSRLYAG